MLEALAKIIRQKEIEWIQIEKEVKVSPFADDKILHTCSPKKLLEMINSFSKMAVYKIDLQKHVAILYTTNRHAEKD